jgi:hypothetical protein
VSVRDLAELPTLREDFLVTVYGRISPKAALEAALRETCLLTCNGLTAKRRLCRDREPQE